MAERIYKVELAHQIGISSNTLRRICNFELFDGLQEIGYKRCQKYFQKNR
jgi:hypothetical protein